MALTRLLAFIALATMCVTIVAAQPTKNPPRPVNPSHRVNPLQRPVDLVRTTAQPANARLRNIEASVARTNLEEARDRFHNAGQQRYSCHHTQEVYRLRPQFLQVPVQETIEGRNWLASNSNPRAIRRLGARLPSTWRWRFLLKTGGDT